MGTRLTSKDLELLDPAQRRAVGGRTAHKAGANFEKSLDSLHLTYRMTGRAFLVRMPVPTSPAGMSRGRPVRVTTGKSGVDFWGTVKVQDGFRTVAIEVKSTSKEVASLALVRPDASGKEAGAGIKMSQLKFLVDGMAFGITPLILWANGGPVASGGRIGWMGPASIRRAAEIVPTRIGSAWFTWLLQGDDWLEGVTRAMAESPEVLGF